MDVTFGPAAVAVVVASASATTTRARIFGISRLRRRRLPPGSLGYDSPRGDKISVVVIGMPAAKHHKRLGSLVVNPGGPGGSGVDFVRFAGPFLFTPEVRARFDIVSCDPRGIIRSNPLQCFRSEEQWQPLDLGIAFPTTQAEIDAWIGADGYLVQVLRRAGRRDHRPHGNRERRPRHG